MCFARRMLTKGWRCPILLSSPLIAQSNEFVIVPGKKDACERKRNASQMELSIGTLSIAQRGSCPLQDFK